MKCPLCNSNMVEKPPEEISNSNPRYYRKIMWCGCGYQEDCGVASSPSPVDNLRERWEQVNNPYGDGLYAPV